MGQIPPDVTEAEKRKPAEEISQLTLMAAPYYNSRLQPYESDCT